MNKYLKKFSSVLLFTMIISSIFSICVLASTPPAESKWAFITSSQSKAYSGEVNGTYKVFGGDNYANSEHALTICSQYKEGNEWKYDKKIRVGINQTLNDTNTTFKSSSYKWRVYLKPYAAWQTGCNGEGYIWYDM